MCWLGLTATNGLGDALGASIDDDGSETVISKFP